MEQPSDTSEDKAATLFKTFWNDKKILFESIGVVFVVGGLFLSIPNVSSDEASRSLDYLKLSWLLLILIALFVLVIQLIIFSFKLESSVIKKKVDFLGTIAFDSVLIGIALLYVVGQFTWYQYGNQIIAILENPYVYTGLFYLLLRIRFTVFHVVKKQITSWPVVVIFWILLTVVAAILQVLPLLLSVEGHYMAFTITITPILVVFYLLTDTYQKILKISSYASGWLSAITMLILITVIAYRIGARIVSA